MYVDAYISAASWIPPLWQIISLKKSSGTIIDAIDIVAYNITFTNVTVSTADLTKQKKYGDRVAQSLADADSTKRAKNWVGHIPHLADSLNNRWGFVVSERIIQVTRLRITAG